MKKSFIPQWIVAGIFALCTLGNGFHWTSVLLALATFLMMPIPAIRNLFAKFKIKTWMIITVSVILLFVGILNSPTPSDPENGGLPSTTVTTSSTVTSTTKSTTTTKPTTTTPKPTTTTPKPTTTTPNPTTTTPKPTTTTPKPTTTTPKPTTTTPKPTTTTPKPTTTTPKPTTTTSRPTVTTPIEDKLVWIPTNGGTKYHSKSTCSQMIDPIQVTIQEAINQGFTPCGRCYGSRHALQELALDMLQIKCDIKAVRCTAFCF